MIKRSTVIKRMVKDNWKPISLIAGTVTLLLIVSNIAEYLWGVDSFNIYLGLVAVWFIGTGLKWGYDAKRSQIEFEHRELLRDIERKHL
jgi:predicted membrane protein